ncbi:MAG: glutaminase [Bacteroidales bacterium]|nr:glutaminase [Bacteroidales bacterium]NCU35530.1 glutaminase [Candidatus Falkowbacteria bacterium]MDD2633269.1 glutaminase [Bacteroidales bacterium]MDD4177323.1 glutaminase [Bacteroidales bacterium]MDD4741251.1 glutaminase [Bacteroidales bacterium]
MSCQTPIQTVFDTIMKLEDAGELATYIPELAHVDPNKFGVCLSTVDNRQFSYGNATDRFSIQSIAKVLALSMAYKMPGGEIWERVGVEPSGSPFNSLVQLEADNGIPRNPLINAGALVICDILLSNLKNPLADFMTFIRDVADNPYLNYSHRIAESEKSVGYRNIALCYFIKSFGNIKNHPKDVLEFYFMLCSIEMSCVELSRTFLFLANQGRKTSDNKEILTLSQAKRINAIMQMCGFYDESGEFAYEVGLPGKSGVGGGIVAIHPNTYSIAVWSPRLNKKGNSYRGMKFLELFTTETASSIF